MEYYGANQSLLQNSARVATSVKESLTRNEASLYATKWFDYRFTDEGPLHPLEASRLFAQEFSKVYIDYYARRVDLHGSLSQLGLDNVDLLRCAATQITGIWKSRQAADKYGVKYDFWCWTAFKYIETFNWARLPRPTHLYAKNSKASKKEGFLSITDYIVAEWKKHRRENFIYAESSFYRVTEVERPYHPYQAEHMSYLIWKLDRSANRHLMVATLVFDKGLLTPEIVLKHYGSNEGADLLRRAERFAA